MLPATDTAPAVRDARPATDTVPGARDARIGPNAIIQVAEALRAHEGPQSVAAVFARAGLSAYLTTPPTAMVAQSEVRRLFAELARRPDGGRAILVDAGYRTGEYLLANRIPPFARWLLPRLPRAWATSVLVRAIRAHAWTFAGSGTVSVSRFPTTVLQINANPLAPGGCPWHAAVFETLFRALVDPSLSVRGCSCRGGGQCRFEIRPALARPASGQVQSGVMPR